MRSGTLWVTGDENADGLCNTDPLALMIGMLLDQQIPIEWAFAGPARLRDRLATLPGGSVPLTASAIAALDPDVLITVACEKPAIHRFPAVMARRIQELSAHVVDEYAGDPARIWVRRRSADTVVTRLLAVPGYGDEKSRIFLALLAKRFGIRPAGWEIACAPYGDHHPRSVADMGSEADRAAVRAWRKDQKAKGKTKAD